MAKLISGLAVVVFVLSGAVASAAPVEFKPVELSQPDGSVVSLFVTGDEFYHWVHDESGLPVERDEDGWIVYVGERGETPVLSAIPAGIGDPLAMGLAIEPGPPITDAAVRRIVDEGRAVRERGPRSLVKRFGGPYRGTINQLVVFVRFSDEEEFTDEQWVFDTMFNSDGDDAVSLDAYYNEVSYGRLRVGAHFFPRSDNGIVVSYQDSQPRRYYQPNSDRNPSGYYGEQNGLYRLASMLDRAIKFIKPQVPADLDLDLDNDGFADNVVFIVSGDADDWANALWPHAYVMLYDNYINGARLLPYNLQFRDWLLERSVGVLAHEFFHAIGSPDLYRYVNRELTPAGSWDLMEHNREPPQHMTGWMKYRYGGFIDDVPAITESGRYTLKPLTSPTDNVLQIPVPGEKYQSLVVEYRKKEGTYESSVPGTGLIVYRVDRLVNGNADGPPDELYVLRPGGHPDTDGDVDNAFMSIEAGRTRVDEHSDPYPFAQNRMPIPVRIFDIVEDGDTISFSVCVRSPDCIGQECGDDGCGGSCGSCDDHNPCTEDQCVDGACSFIPLMPGTACDDGENCSAEGSCDGQGVCVPAVPVACDDGIDCTVDSCVDGGQWVDLGEDRFEDIMADGADAGVDGDDVASGEIVPGFVFPFMGGMYTSLHVYDNGLIVPGDAVDAALTGQNRALPSPDAPFHAIIAPYWDNLACRLSDHCVVAWKVMGEVPDRRLVIQWNKAVVATHPDIRVYFQAVIFESGRIEFRYRDMGIHDGLRATVGIESPAGDHAWQWSFDERKVRSGMTLMYSPGFSECVARPRPGTCLVDGECVAAGTVSPDNACVECRPLVNLGGWAYDDANACTDENACTRADICRAGACIGTDPVVCKPVNQCYTAGTCDQSTGVCSNPLKDDGTLCNFDSNGCTQGDYCVAGTCLVGAAPDCSAKDSECAVGRCVSKSSNQFRCEAKTEPLAGVACGDPADECSGQDTCDGKGKCAPNDFGTDVVCRAAVGDCDIADYCDGSGTCGDNEILDDGTACGWDGTRVCMEGHCVVPLAGDDCPDAVVLQEGQARRGTVAFADTASAGGSACAAGPDVYYRADFRAGVEYELSVVARDGNGDFAFSVLDSCDADRCADVEDAGRGGEAESRVVKFNADTTALVRVVKMDRSASVDFVIELSVVGAGPADEGGGDIIGGDTGGESGGTGCSQSGSSGAMPLLMLFMMTGIWAVFRRFAARRG